MSFTVDGCACALTLEQRRQVGGGSGGDQGGRHDGDEGGEQDLHFEGREKGVFDKGQLAEVLCLIGWSCKLRV